MAEKIQKKLSAIFSRYYPRTYFIQKSSAFLSRFLIEQATRAKFDAFRLLKLRFIRWALPKVEKKTTKITRVGYCL